LCEVMGRQHRELWCPMTKQIKIAKEMYVPCNLIVANFPQRVDWSSIAMRPIWRANYSNMRRSGGMVGGNVEVVEVIGVGGSWAL